MLVSAVLKQLGSNDGRVTKVNKRKVAKEKIHRSVKFGVNLDDYYHAKISYHGDNVHAQKHEEERNLKFWVICETHEGKGCVHTQISCSHHYRALERRRGRGEEEVVSVEENLYGVSEKYAMMFCGR